MPQPDMYARKHLADQSMLMSARFDALDQQTQQIISMLLETSKITAKDTASEDSRAHIVKLTHTLTQLLNRLDKPNEENNRRNRELITAQHRPFGMSSYIGKPTTSSLELLSVSNEEEPKQREWVETKIMESLYFEMMTRRYEKVGEAYPNTFRWIF